MAQLSPAVALQQLLLGARQCLKACQPDRAAQLLQSALKIDSSNALALFLLGQAYGALKQHAAAADAFRQAFHLTAAAAAPAPGSQRHQLHVAAAENMLLECERVLPPNWIAALNDAPRMAALEAGIAAAVQAAAAAAGGQPPRVLVCGGFGLEAVLAAQAGAEAVALYCEADPLSARLAAELGAANGCADRLTLRATSAEQLLQAAAVAAGQDQNPGQPQLQSAQPYHVLISADALGSSIDWGLLQRQLAAVRPILAPATDSVVILPHAVHTCGMLVQCPAAVGLNEVDVAAMRADSAGLDFSEANRLLPRSRRSVRLPTYPHLVLTSNADDNGSSSGSSGSTLLSVQLAHLLPDFATTDGGCTAMSISAEVELLVTAAGAADALCWWYEQELVPAGGSCNGDEGQQQKQQVLRRLTSDPTSCTAGDAMLHPHVWQHLQYLDHRQLAAGQQVTVRCTLAASSSAAAAAAVTAAASEVELLSLADGGTNSGSNGGGPHVLQGTGAGFAELNLQVDVLLSGNNLLLPVEQPAIAAAVPRYHTSMLNDAYRTHAYRQGIAAAMREAEVAGSSTSTAAGSHAPEEAGTGSVPPLVLEIGSGSGLLCMLACQAGAQRVIGCERLPELQHAAARLLEANGCAGKVTILPKHSKELTVSTDGEEADLPRPADVLMHEIFGSDPFSEGVVPTMAHAKQHLLRPDATLAPCKLHVIAAVAAGASQHRLMRPPPTVCGGSVSTAALRQLVPRKVDCQAGEAHDLYLLTTPQSVLSVDFGAAELALEDSCTAPLELLPRPQLIGEWMAAELAAAEAGSAAAAAAAAAAAPDSKLTAQQQPALEGASLYVVSWFEYEFPGGVCASTAPHVQRTEHWQQVVQPLEGAAAEAVLNWIVSSGGSSTAGGCSGLNSSSGTAADELGGPSSGASLDGMLLLLTAGYRVDRLWFELEGIAAPADEDEVGRDEEA